MEILLNIYSFATKTTSDHIFLLRLLTYFATVVRFSRISLTKISDFQALADS
uniref:Uncharacterized protein n=1 Tax=Rhizophora mucronata TaxID=61149 RepID=A0A2P2PEJ1_RHIMU